jgi:hypothetical protein
LLPNRTAEIGTEPFNVRLHAVVGQLFATNFTWRSVCRDLSMLHFELEAGRRVLEFFVLGVVLQTAWDA